MPASKTGKTSSRCYPREEHDCNDAKVAERACVCLASPCFAAHVSRQCFPFRRKVFQKRSGQKEIFFLFSAQISFRHWRRQDEHTASSALKFFTYRSFHFGQHSSGHQPLILSLAPVIEKLGRKFDLYICSSNFRLAMSSTEEFDAEQAKLQKSVYDEHNYAFTSKMIKKLNRQMLLNQLSAKIPVPKKVVEQSLAGKSC